MSPVQRALIVNCYADETRLPVARRHKVPNTLGPVFLAGGLHPRQWHIRLHNEVSDGPLEDEALLGWPDLLVLTGLITSVDRMRQVAAYAREWFWRAPVILAICVLPGEAWTRAYDGQNFAMVDGALALDHMTLAAAEAGLGTCWIGAFDPAAARDILGLPDGVEIVGLTPLGFPDAEPHPRPRSRRPLGETVMKERWG